MKKHYHNFLFFSVLLIVIMLPVLFFTGCSEKNQSGSEQAVIQVSTIDALMTGVYEGNTTLKDLARWGDFGIGTFNALDGEMVLLDETFFQVQGSGVVNKPEPSTQTPFATVTFFNPESDYPLSGLSFDGLKSVVDSLMKSPNLFYAMRVTGTFNRVKTRSVPAQTKPFLPLVEVTASQPEFETDTITGILSGFYCPPFVKGVNVPGYHLHFISDDHSFGGHVLSFELEAGTLEIDQIERFILMLPHDNGFLEADLTEDLSEELEDVEGGD
jgi:acetolactate decarboxylase